jgi:plasmid stabilization system protein ParE
MYRVEWLDTAFNQTDELIRGHPVLQDAFAAALQRLTRDLSQWPLEVGESRPDGRRIGFFGPLVVYYRVLASERVVRVISVHLRPHRAGS